MAATALLETVRAHDVDYELLAHPRTMSAAAEARVLEVPLEQTAKTVIVRTASGFARVVVPASRRIDLKRVARALDDPTVGLATERELAGAYPEFELGAVPPFDGTLEDDVVVDAHLLATDHVVFEAGTHLESVRMCTADMVELANARIAEVCGRP
jgi:Ala-tRNA(Pro) deacylase